MSDLISNPEKYKKGWTGGLPETPCGFGSTMAATVAQREWIPGIIEKYFIESIADIGAGDLNWIKSTPIPNHVEYTAYDLVPRKPEVIKFDLIEQIPPPVDLIMCLWVLNHLPYEACQMAIANIKKSGAKYLLMTDRLRYKEDQPPEVEMPAIESMALNDKGDSIKLIDLDSV
jgi:hypothetical protein